MKKNSRLDFLDFAKGFAMLAIVLFHYIKVFNFSFLSNGGIGGIHLFIFLSGFGLVISKKRSLKVFYIRRFFKIILPYYIAVSVIYLFAIFIPIYADSSLYAYLGHIFLYKMFDNSIMESFGDHFWFMSTIVQLYILYPLLRFIQRNILNSSFFAVSLLISILYWFFIWYYNLGEKRIYASSSIQLLWEFSCGMVAAKLYAETGFIFYKIRNGFLVLLTLIGFGSKIILAYYGGNAGKIFNDIPAFIGFISLSILAFNISKYYIPYLCTLMKKIGEFSYSLYLLHLFPLALLIHYIGRENYNIFYFCGLFIFVIIISYYYELFIKKVFYNRLL